jgi:AcrR family transcriptional regulator
MRGFRRMHEQAIAIRMRRLYRIDMPVSGQAIASASEAEKGPRARMRRTMLDTAMRLMQSGRIPSVSDVAEAARVSRATAYRYFPSQATMIAAAVGEALGPILAWESDSTDAEERVGDLLAFAFPRIEEYEATHRAALLMSLDQWTRRQAGTLGGEERFVRGNRKRLLSEAAGPLRGKLRRQSFDRLVQSLSLIFGTEALVVLKDIWGLDGNEARRVAIWAAHALVRAASAEAQAVGLAKPATPTKKRTALKPVRRRK